MAVRDMFDKYLRSVSSKFSHKETSEMGYRPDFEILLKGIFESIKVKRIDNDPKASEGNRPDFVLYKEVPILYIETKDIGVSLDKVEKSEQMARYFGYANLVLTDYLEFRFYRNGKAYGRPIKIGNHNSKKRSIDPLIENYESLARTLIDFAQSHKEPIKSGEHLAKIMGGKAQRIRDNIRYFLSVESEKNEDIQRVYEAIKKLLVHDLKTDAFADMYAQTLVYGLFVARYYDDTPETFSREEAREHMPASNPFLRHFFDHIAGPSFDKRLKYIVDELCLVFQHSNVKQLIEQYMKGADPVIHFYEDFLKEYDPVLRKKMGAYYTPLPVVRFIVRAVDHLLEKEFGLAGGLADTAKLANGRHRVQVLDPAAGTGTFISAVIRMIYERLKKQGQEGRWTAYVHNDLLPRLHGFELMMAPYTIAHLKLSLAFKQTGFWKFHRRLGIYLTNSLEKSDHQQTELAFGFAESIAEEAREADKVKNETPIMVVVGNPPYSGESSNAGYKGNDVYKVEPTGGKLRERNSKWLNDDYVKFIRYAESIIEKNGEGVVAMITAHGYIDNPTFRGMRYHLMKTFKDIYIFDLHGNANKKEVAPEGGKDENVFDIKTGVAIIIAVKQKIKTNKLANIHRADCFGLRENKFQNLGKNKIDKMQWISVKPSMPNYEWVARDRQIESEYLKGFSVKALFDLNNTGIVTKRDELCIQDTSDSMWQAVQDFLNLSEADVRRKYHLPADVRDWKYEWAKKDLLVSGPSKHNITPINYRPFDRKYLYYTGRARGFVGWPVERITKHFIAGDNIALVAVNRSPAKTPASYCFVTKSIISNGYIRSDSVSIDTIFPLYLYLEDGAKQPNFKREIVASIEDLIGRVLPEDIFDYVYAILYSPSYRKKYNEFLKTDFPRIPYPKNKKTFKALVALGEELCGLHLLELPKVNKFITTYPVAGSNEVEKISYKDGKVFINKKQYFGGVPEIAWNFYIGGYQPAQKWLKDRKRRTLTNADIEHYQKMIVALTETDRIMKEIDKVGVPSVK
ncbi:MAG: N-6 DNA methylase [Candidatus Saganbacteria bacterium]|nr:N-6 DNA methylase [Candidatus Saganbacteria bacterium]